MSIESAKSLDFVEVSVVTHNGETYDVSDNVSEFNIYEDIDRPFVHGELALIDNSGIANIFPLIGHEVIRIRFKRLGETSATIDKTFFVNGINNMKQINEQTATVMITLISPVQLVNAQSTFSKAYRGLNTDMIREMYNEYFKRDIDKISNGGTSHSVVFPYVKPLDAISMVLQNTYADDGTPLYLYETLYGNKLELRSWGEMMSAPIDTKLGVDGTISPIPLSNQAKDAKASRNIPDWANRLDTVNVVDGYSLYDGIAAGWYKHDLAHCDVSKKTYNLSVYDYRKSNGTPKTRDYVRDSMYSDNIKTNSLFRTQVTNDYAFNEDLPVLNSTSPTAMSNMKSFRNRMSTMRLEGGGPGIEGLRIGKCVGIDIPIRKPSFLAHEDQRDQINSGKYLVSAIRHTYKNKRYVIGIEMVRDGMNPDARIK